MKSIQCYTNNYTFLNNSIKNESNQNESNMKNSFDYVDSIIEEINNIFR